MSGMITGISGGILRDVLCNQVPVVFRRELYASVSMARMPAVPGAARLGCGTQPEHRRVLCRWPGVAAGGHSLALAAAGVLLPAALGNDTSMSKPSPGCLTAYSTRFDDRYHGEQGLAQARDVFCTAAVCQRRGAGAQQWRILETGFGFGLNFLATWAAWRADPARPRLPFCFARGPGRCRLTTCCARPSATQSCRPRPELRQYWGLLPGIHRLWLDDGHVLLTLCIGDAQALLRQQLWEVDAGVPRRLQPQRNPAIWAQETLKAMARHCRRGTRLATWTVARSVRDALTQCGFQVEMVAGLPPSGATTCAPATTHWQPRGETARPEFTSRRCLVLGAGLAGATAAASLARRGWQVTLLDAARAPAAGASGLPVGLLRRTCRRRQPVCARVSRAGVRAMLQQLVRSLQAGVDWNRPGCLSAAPPANWKTCPPPGPMAGTDWSQAAGADHLAAAGLPLDTSALAHPRRPGARRV